MLLDPAESMATRPDRLIEKSQKFYDVNPANTISAKREALKVQQVNIDEILKWLDEIWLNGDLYEYMTEDEYLDFRKAIEESGQ